MKLTAILLFAAALQVSAKSGGQAITLSMKQAPLEKVFKAIQKQSGYAFVFFNNDLAGTKDVDVHLQSASIKDALNQCIAGQPLSYSISDKTVIIKRIKSATVIPTEVEGSLPAAHDIRVHITDSLGNPLQGASVVVKGTKQGGQADAGGNITLAGLTGDENLVVSFVGYETEEVNVGNKSVLSIILKASTSPLDEMQVIAYGTTTRRFSVGSISTVDAATIEKQPVTNPLLALQGQVPGLVINATSGAPGSRVLAQVRGQNTILNNPQGVKPYDQPLFIIDGVPFAPQNSNINQLYSIVSNNINIGGTSIGGVSERGGISPFNNINPSDIESISILKDADATSIYGSEGANGVILITTKKGKAGKTTFNLSINTGFNSDAQPVQLLNTQQYLQLRKDAFTADSITPNNDPNDYNGYAPDLTIFDQNKYTNWQKVIFGKTSNNTDVHGQLSGGSLNNTFLISAGYTKSTYNFPGDYADQRWTMHSAFRHASTDNRFTLNFITDYGYDQNNSPAIGSSQQILLSPNTPDLLDSSGNLVWNYKGVDLSSYQFYGYLKELTDLQNYNFNSSLHIAYKIWKGLSISANLGYNRNTTSEHSQYPAVAQSPSNPNRSAHFTNNAFQTINIEPQINYTKHVGRGTLSALVGATYKKNTNNSNQTDGYGYANDNFLGSINGAPTVYSSDNASIYKYSAGFARLQYIYNQKYIVSLTGRRDGSSNFGPGRQFGDFGSVGGGWIFSEEKEFKKTLPFISYGKLSGNYGTNGSDGIAAYQYQAFWQPFSSAPAFQGVQPNVPGNLYNPDYSWAIKKSLNLALDLGLFHDHLLLNATYYRDREGNQLVAYPLPIQTGFSSVVENLTATIQNQGWEFSATSNNVKTKHFSWTTNFNITFNRNKLLSFPNLASSSYSQSYVIGQPTSIIFGYKYKDVNPQTGLFEFYNKDGQVTSSPNYGFASTGGDMIPIANGEVNYMGGFGNNLSYKHFGLYIFCQFSSQMASNWLATAYNDNNLVGMAYNVPVAVLNNYWKNSGDQALLQRLASGYSSNTAQSASYFAQSSGVYSNDTYLRLKTVALSYSLPDSFTKKLHLQNCSVYVNAQNLLTITNYKVGDPEQFNYTSFPLQRIVAFGLNLNF